MIQPYVIHDRGWDIIISGGGTRYKRNTCRYNMNRSSRTCVIDGCNNTFQINRTSGLCDAHENHLDDLVLSIRGVNEVENARLPSHSEIVDQLITWAKSRNYRLEEFFTKLSFSILGNIPDVSTLSGFIEHEGHNIPTLESLVTAYMLNIVDEFFPSLNSSSYQELATTRGDFPVRVLAIVISGLVFCEEANRGDRWFCRTILKRETLTTQLGGAMPIVYFAARNFNWGIEMEKVLPYR